jgi:hypothetical protein
MAADLATLALRVPLPPVLRSFRLLATMRELPNGHAEVRR